MGRRHTYKSTPWNRRTARLAITLWAIPALALSPLSARAILIHDHLGHDTHTHALHIHELDELRHNVEHRHEGHEHHGSIVQSADVNGDSYLILFHYEAFTRGRVQSAGMNTVAAMNAGASINPVAIVARAYEHLYRARPSGAVPPLRAQGALYRLLLTSQALLL